MVQRRRPFGFIEPCLPSKVWLKAKNPESAAVRREREEQWR
jgi:hypothetical protein